MADGNTQLKAGDQVLAVLEPGKEEELPQGASQAALRRLASLLALPVVLVGCGGESSNESQPAATGYRSPRSRQASTRRCTSRGGAERRLYVVEQEGRIRIVRNGRITGTSSTSARGSGVLRRAGPPLGCVPSALREERALLRLLHGPGEPRRRVPRPACGSHAAERRRPVLEPQRRSTRVRARRSPLRRHGGLGLRRRSGEPRAEHGFPVRQAARDQRRSTRRALADRRPGSAQSMALLVRPQDGRPLHRRCRPELLGGGRLHAEVEPGARELRLGRLRRPGQVRGQVARPRQAGLPDRHLSPRGPLRRHGGFVYRGSAVPSARGRYFYGDNCSGAVWSLRVVGRQGAKRSPGAIPARGALVLRRGRPGRALRRHARRHALPASAPASRAAAAHLRALLPQRRVRERLERVVQQRELSYDRREVLAAVQPAVEALELGRQAVEALEQRVELAITDVLGGSMAQW